MYKPSKTSMPDNNAGMIAMANASKDAAITQSNNNLMGMQTQAAVMELGILTNSANSQFGIIAFLAKGLDDNSTKLEIATEHAKLAITEEEDRHAEQGDKHAERMRELEIEAADAGRPESFGTDSFRVG